MKVIKAKDAEGGNEVIFRESKVKVICESRTKTKEYLTYTRLKETLRCMRNGRGIKRRTSEG